MPGALGFEDVSIHAAQRSAGPLSLPLCSLDLIFLNLHPHHFLGDLHQFLEDQGCHSAVTEPGLSLEPGAISEDTGFYQQFGGQNGKARTWGLQLPSLRLQIPFLSQFPGKLQIPFLMGSDATVPRCGEPSAVPFSPEGLTVPLDLFSGREETLPPEKGSHFSISIGKLNVCQSKHSRDNTGCRREN